MLELQKYRPMPESQPHTGPRPQPPTGRHNALLRELRRTVSHGTLTADDCFLVEGVRLLEEALRSGVRLHTVFFSQSAGTRVDRLLPQINKKVERLLLPEKTFNSIVASETPQGVAALVHRKQHSLEDVLTPEAPLLIVAAGLQDPGNLGTLLRSAEAFGANGVVIGEETVSVFNPKTIRATAGSIFRLPILQMQIEELLPKLRARGLRLVATSSHKGSRLDEADLSGPLAIFIGNEGSGLPRKLLAQLDASVVIPQAAHVESLNAGVAAGIVLYEAARQRAKQ